MANTIEHIFVYGTLRRASNHPNAIFLGEQTDFCGEARTPGRLYQVVTFPGMKPAQEAGEWVVGDLYRLRPENADDILAALDRYEGCSADDPKPWYFERCSARVTTAETSVDAWVYVYCPDVNESQRIKSGEYNCGNLADFDWTKER